jgi:hypothetical protein
MNRESSRGNQNNRDYIRDVPRDQPNINRDYAPPKERDNRDYGARDYPSRNYGDRDPRDTGNRGRNNQDSDWDW